MPHIWSRICAVQLPHGVRTRAIRGFYVICVENTGGFSQEVAALLPTIGVGTVWRGGLRLAGFVPEERSVVYFKRFGNCCRYLMICSCVASSYSSSLTVSFNPSISVLERPY